MSMLCFFPFDDNGELNKDRLYYPAKMRKPQDMFIDFDLFKRSDELIDVCLAVVCSSGQTRFFYEGGRCAKSRDAYFRRLAKRGVKAGKDYYARMLAHFKKYKYQFREGYSLPSPPTPEVRAIYDSAARWERRPLRPEGTTLHNGFSLGEYHWREWPLSNLLDLDDGGERPPLPKRRRSAS